MCEFIEYSTYIYNILKKIIFPSFCKIIYLLLWFIKKMFLSSIVPHFLENAIYHPPPPPNDKYIAFLAYTG